MPRVPHYRRETQRERTTHNCPRCPHPVPQGTCRPRRGAPARPWRGSRCTARTARGRSARTTTSWSTSAWPCTLRCGGFAPRLRRPKHRAKEGEKGWAPGVGWGKTSFFCLDGGDHGVHSDSHHIPAIQALLRLGRGCRGLRICCCCERASVRPLHTGVCVCVGLDAHVL